MSNNASSPATPWEKAWNVTMKEPLVTIPRAQHEALMAAAKALEEVYCWWDSGRQRQLKALAALRAAGVQIEGE